MTPQLWCQEVVSHATAWWLYESGGRLRVLGVLRSALTDPCASGRSLFGRLRGQQDLRACLYEAFGRGDADTVLGSLAADVDWREAETQPYADGNPYIGPQRVGEGVFGRIMSDYDGFAVNPQRFVADGDTVAVAGRYTGTHKASGESLDAQFAHFWTVRDGKVAKFQQYTDTAQMSRILG
ncbi:MAG TPA: nuclear transport factor 2 family protein [Longimicrobiales bacterium]|nr:nuclear transport factor 2 family protein [Longimicrobiales bacterium]